MPRVQPRRIVPALAVLLVAGPPLAATQAEHRAMLRAKLQRELTAVADSFDGVLGAQVVDLTDSARLGVNAELVFPQGSAIKIAILVELFSRAAERPRLLRERRAVTAAARAAGSGVLQRFGDGTSTLALEDLAVLMIVLSDNTATNILIDELGMEAVNRMLAGLGLSRTRLRRKMIRPDASARGEENVSTPAEAATLMTRLAWCALPISREGCRRLREILEIPKGDAVRETVPAAVPVASKPGGIEGVATVWALVDLPDRPYAIAVMTNYGGGDGDDALRRVSRAAYEYFSRLARATPYGTRVPLEVIRQARPREP